MPFSPRLVAVLLVLTCFPQPPPPALQAPAATFRVQVNFVEIDAIVTDRDGRFVRDLTAADFEILEDGTPQAVRTFAVTDIPEPDAAAPVRRGPEPDVASNAQVPEGRVFLLVLDDLHTTARRTRFVQDAAREFVLRHAGPHDLIAVAHVGTSAHNQDFTDSRARVLAAIDAFIGRKLRTLAEIRFDKTADESFDQRVREDHARRSYATLREFSALLGGIRGRRKALVYFGEGVDVDTMSKVDVSGDNTPDIAREIRALQEDLRALLATATPNNVTMYAFDPRGLTTGDEELIGIPEAVSIGPVGSQGISVLTEERNRAHDMLRTIAEATGGAAFLNANAPGRGFERIIDDTSRYYTLGYEAPEGRRGYRGIEVRVKRPGLAVRARRGYLAPGARTTPAAAPSGRLSRELRDAMSSPLPIAGLPFSVSAVPFRGTRAQASVAVIVEIHPGRLGFTERNGTFATDVELQMIAVEVASARRHGSHHVAALRLRGPTHQAVLREGVRITRRFEVPPGRYRVQIGARDATSGAAGTVFVDLDVPDPGKAPIVLSGLALASAAATRAPTVNDDRQLDAVLPGAPTARREFPSNDTLAVFCEVFTGADAAPVPVRATVASAGGRIVFEHAVELKAGATRPYSATIALGGMPSGAYVLRVEAGASGAATRSVAFRIR
jgi:VWFA-related protein